MKDIIRGRIEAYEHAAQQFEVYADDNEALLNRRGYITKRWERAAIMARILCWRDVAKELREYAAQQRKALE